MFAFALYDGIKRTLYLVRDRVGIKPLFYYLTPDRLLFSSEILSLLQAKDVERKILAESLSGFFRYQYVPTPATIYKNLYKLEPGCYLEVDSCGNHIRKQRYWELAVNLTTRREEDWLEELNVLLDETIRMYVRSDVPFGAFLSGGVDSSLVTALMAGHLDHPVRTFTIGFKEEVHSELPFAAQASRIVQTNHFEKVISPDLAEEILSHLVIHFGEPFADSSAIPTYYVSREAARQVKMVLSGDGGDELFGGYNSYPITFQDFINGNRRWPTAIFNFGVSYGVLPFLRSWAREKRTAFYQEKHDAQRQIFNDRSLREILADDISVYPAVSFRVAVGSPDVDPVSMFQAQDFKTYLVDDVLTKVDRMSMANSLEVRVPLLDHKLVEFAFSLPLSLKLRKTDATGRIETKYLLKKSAARFYTEGFLARPKQGFGIPIIEWCRGPLKQLFESKLREKANPIYEWIKYPYVQEMFKSFFAGDDTWVTRLWFVLMFSLWHEYVHRAH
jgi:asparagine synthase (glutamine-hydrolysing)